MEAKFPTSPKERLFIRQRVSVARADVLLSPFLFRGRANAMQTPSSAAAAAACVRLLSEPPPLHH